MRKVVLLEHMSLDGFVGGPNGEMDWIRLCDEQWETVTAVSAEADTAIYGRATYGMMAGYWPTAAQQPGATQHDKDHGNWVNAATKLVFSSTLKDSDVASWPGTKVIGGDVLEAMETIKQQPGKNLLLLGSPGLARSFNRLGLIDEYWLYLNPVILGKGLPLFEGRTDLTLISNRTLPNSVIELHYEKA